MKALILLALLSLVPTSGVVAGIPTAESIYPSSAGQTCTVPFKQYKLLCRGDNKLLSDQVSQALAEGWFLYGGPSTWGSVSICQAIVKF